VDTSEIKNGLTIEIDGDPYKVMSFSIMKQARGATEQLRGVSCSHPLATLPARLSDRHSGIALDELAQREEARTSNPILQQIARANAGQAAASVSLASWMQSIADGS
jgi:hypothetical protein